MSIGVGVRATDVTVKEFREPGVTTLVSSTTVDPDGHFLFCTQVGQLDQRMDYANLLSYVSASVGARVEPGTDGLRVASAALGAGLGGGGASTITCDINGLSERTSPVDTDMLYLQTAGGALQKISYQKLTESAVGNTDLGTNYALTNVVVTSSTGDDTTINQAGALAGVMSAADKTKLDGISPGATDFDGDDITLTGDVTSVGEVTEIAAGVVGTTELVDASVTTAKIAPANVTNATLAAMNGGTFKGSITTGEPIDVDVSAVVEEPTPGSGHMLLGWVSGNWRKFNVTNLPTGGGGEVNTATNANLAGIGVVANPDKVGTVLQFRGVDAGSSKITTTLDGAAKTIDIDVDPSQINTSELNNDAGWSAGGATSLGTTYTATTFDITSDTGGDATVAQAIAGGNAGAMSGADKQKLDGVADNANNYSHPNHTGEVTSTGDGAQLITSNAVTNVKLADMNASTVKGRAAGTTGDPQDLGRVDVSQQTPVAGYWLLGWGAGDTLRRFSTDELISGGGGGEINTGDTIGTATDPNLSVYDSKTGTVLYFRALLAGSTKASVSRSGGDLVIDVVPGNILTSTLNNDANWSPEVLLSGDVETVAGGVATIQPDAVETAMIADGQVTTAKIAATNVTEPTIADNAIVNRCVADNAINTAEIAPEAVTTARMADEPIDTFIGRIGPGDGEPQYVGRDTIPIDTNPEAGDRLVTWKADSKLVAVDVDDLPAANSNAGIINVKDSPYGAVGDGVNDDTPAIQAALDAAEADDGGSGYNRRAVFLPAGTYRVVNTLDIQDRIKFYGSGRQSTIIRFEASAPDTACLQMSDGRGVSNNAGNYEYHWFGSIEDLTVQLNDQVHENLSAIFLQNTTRSIIRNVYVNADNMTVARDWYGLRIKGREQLMVHQCSFDIPICVYIEEDVDGIGPDQFTFTDCSYLSPSQGGTGNTLPECAYYVHPDCYLQKITWDGYHMTAGKVHFLLHRQNSLHSETGAVIGTSHSNTIRNLRTETPQDANAYWIDLNGPGGKTGWTFESIRLQEAVNGVYVQNGSSFNFVGCDFDLAGKVCLKTVGANSFSMDPACQFANNTTVELQSWWQTYQPFDSSSAHGSEQWEISFPANPASYHTLPHINNYATANSSPITVVPDESANVFGSVAHGLSIGTAVTFSSTDELPAGIQANKAYYILDTPSFTADAFQVSENPTGSVFDFTSDGNGTITAMQTIVALVADDYTQGTGYNSEQTIIVNLDANTRIDQSTNTNGIATSDGEDYVGPGYITLRRTGTYWTEITRSTVVSGSGGGGGGHTFSDQGDVGTSKDVVWTVADRQRIRLTADCTLTFSNPASDDLLTLVISQDATGSRTVTWPAEVQNTDVITYSTVANTATAVQFWFDSTLLKYTPVVGGPFVWS